jgi:uncharacterized protein (TIGR02186 family)
MKRLAALLVFLVFGFWPCAYAGQSSSSVEAYLVPNEVSIGAFFSGTRVTIKGKVPASSEVMITVTGQKEDLKLKKKGRAFGFLWMNIGTMTFHQVPSVYLLYTSSPLDTLTRSHPEWWRQLPEGLESLQEKTVITPPCGEEAGPMFEEFLKLKKQEGLYAFHGGEVRYSHEEGNDKFYEATLDLPAKIPSGRYEVRVSAINGASVMGTSSQYLTVKAVGLPAYLSSFSLNHGMLYGVLAVLTAVGAGLLMDLVFGSKRPH